jgi:hypothetical protein
MDKTFTLRNVECFASGSYKGIEFSDAVVDRMAQDTMEVLDEVQPYLRIGHPPKEGADVNIGDELAKRSDRPALGWLKNLRFIGDRVVTDIAKVPGLVWEAVHKGAYKRVSAEVERDYKSQRTGKVYPYVIKALTLLGAKTPEIKVLRDVVALEADTENARHYVGPVAVDQIVGEEEKEMPPEDDKDKGKVTPKEQVMTVEDAVGALGKAAEAIKVLEAAMAAGDDGGGDGDQTPPAESKDIEGLKKQIADLQTKLTEMQDKVKTATTETEKVRAATRAKEITADVAELINASHKVPPKAEKELVRLMEALPDDKVLEFEEGGKKVSRGLRESLKAVLALLPSNDLLFTEVAKSPDAVASELDAHYKEGESTFTMLGVSKEDVAKYGDHPEFAEAIKKPDEKK